MSLFDELKRRNVIRVGVMYAIVAWLILQVADVVLDNIAAPGWVFQAILLLLILGFPMALLFAWAFELTPTGLKREKDIDRPDSVSEQTGRMLDRTIIVVLLIALGYLTYDKFSGQSVPDEAMTTAVDSQAAAENHTNAVKSIAVLPFVNMSSDPEQEYFSDGISEELLNLLAKIPQFRVAGRTSSFAFKGKDTDLREIGTRLGVDNILEGSVRKGGAGVRITAQLVNAKDGFHLWSETYDRDLTDIFAVQDEIAAAVVAQLRVTLLGIPMSRRGGELLVENAEAYDAYLRGMSYLNKLGPGNYKQAAGFFEKTVAMVPGSALGWARLSYANAQFASQAQEGIESALVRAREAVATAMALDDAVPEVHIASAFINLAFDWNWQDTEVSLQKVFDSRPGDVTAKRLLASIYSVYGDNQRSISILRELVSQDPLNLQIQASLIVDLIAQGEFDAAEAIIRPLLSRSPSVSFLHGYLAIILGQQGRWEESLDAAEKEPVGFMRLMNFAIAHHRLGNSEAAQASQQQLLSDYGDGAAYQQAIVFSLWGDFEKAVYWLERAYVAHDPGLAHIKSTGAFDPLRDLPGYIAILKKMNLAD